MRMIHRFHARTMVTAQVTENTGKSNGLGKCFTLCRSWISAIKSDILLDMHMSQRGFTDAHISLLFGDEFRWLSFLEFFSFSRLQKLMYDGS